MKNKKHTHKNAFEDHFEEFSRKEQGRHEKKKIEIGVDICRMNVEESEYVQQEPQKEREEAITCMKNLNE